MNSSKNILIVDDHLVVRKGIEIIIREEYPKAIIHNAENYVEALEIIKTINVDLIVLDIIINGLEDIKIMKAIKEVQKNTKILIFSCHDEEHYGLRYIKNGADGYLNKYCDEDKIGLAFKEIFSTGKYYSEEIKNKLKANPKKMSTDNPIDSLSNRELEITQMLINGYGNLEIANRLNIQMSTVSTYKNRVFEKLNVNNVVALADVFKENAN